MIPILQNRWRLEDGRLLYYGLRSAPNTLRRSLRVTAAERRALAALDGRTPLEDCPGGGTSLRRLIKLGIVVDVSRRRTAPASLDEARFCRRCAANDFAIPGLELDGDGLCPICRTEARFRRCKNITPVHTDLPRAKTGPYDAAVFYTGGKDSSYLLYYLARVRKLRLLALCWETPYMSPWARESVENARRAMPEVDFWVEKAPDADLKAIYRELYRRQKNVCLCPAVAYVLFLPRLARERIPYLVLGTEPAQCRNFIYNRMAPPFYYRPWIQALARFGFNMGRAFTLRRPMGPGEVECYMMMRQYLTPPGGKKRGLLHNEMMDNIAAALAQAPALLASFRETVERAGRQGGLPRLVHLDLDKAAGGLYRWDEIKAVLTREIGWVDAPVEGKGLHTSCAIERCKEYAQMIQFRDMKSQVIPFSAVELSLASASGTVGREEAVRELKEHSGFTPAPPAEWADMLAYFQEPDGAPTEER